MRYIKTPDATEGTQALLLTIQDALSQHKVLWLLSGGSNIAISCAIMEQLADGLTKNLTIGLIDERYGPVGHPNSNFEQLLQAGFDEKQAALLPVLQESLSLEDTAHAYNQALADAFAENAMLIGQLGIGPDGHTSGILPGSVAVDATDGLLVTSYISDPYERVTTTFTALKQLDVAFVFAFGADKAPTLEKLKTDVSLSEQPAQILKSVPETFIYNDQIGDSI